MTEARRSSAMSTGMRTCGRCGTTGKTRERERLASLWGTWSTTWSTPLRCGRSPRLARAKRCRREGTWSSRVCAVAERVESCTGTKKMSSALTRPLRRLFSGFYSQKRGWVPRRLVGCLGLFWVLVNLFTGVVAPTTCSLTTCLITCICFPNARRIEGECFPNARRIEGECFPNARGKLPRITAICV